MDWAQKLKYFKHALKPYCVAPPFADEQMVAFYEVLGNVVRQYAGQEALRLASEQDDMYAARLAMGQNRQDLEEEAEIFFAQLLGTGDHPPDWISEGDWKQLKLIRDQWM